MTPDWLPDWREESAYPDPAKTSFRQWSWEFLRRNPEYQRHWTWYEEQGIPELDYLPENGDDEMRLCWCDPPAEDGETYREWNQRCDGRAVIKPWSSVLGEKHGIKGMIQDPSEPHLHYALYTGWSPSMLINRGQAPEFYGAMKPERIGEAVAKLDLTLPVDVQLERLGRVLKTAQRRMAERGDIVLHKTSNHVKKFRAYLRLLDAELVQATVGEMAQHVFAEKENLYPTSKLDDDEVKQHERDEQEPRGNRRRHTSSGAG